MGNRGFYPRYMEHRVHTLHRNRELECHSGRSDDAGNGEGPDEMGFQLTTLDAQGNVSCKEPDTLAKSVS